MRLEPIPWPSLSGNGHNPSSYAMSSHVIYPASEGSSQVNLSAKAKKRTLHFDCTFNPTVLLLVKNLRQMLTPFLESFIAARCLISGFDGGLFTVSWKEA
jgi:hypothetical protein